MDVLEAIERRRSIRGYLAREVPEAVLKTIFGAAQRAPSWCNIQPWRVWVASGASADLLRQALLDAARGMKEHPDVPFPARYPGAYGERRIACAKALYGAMGIERHDKAGRDHAWIRNFGAFGAPHIAIVGIDKTFGGYAMLDVGCWLQTVLLAAEAHGVSCCAQASLASYPSVLRQRLPIPKEVHILFGIAMGYADTAADANACRTNREPLGSNVTFV